MTTSRRATLSLVAAVVTLVLTIAAASGGTPQASEDAGDAGGGGISQPGLDGPDGPPISLPPDDGSLVHDIDPCGVEVISGTGPDASVGFAPCPGDEPPTEPNPTIVSPTPGMANVYPRGFDTATVGAGGRTVTIDFVSGIEPCYVLDRVDVRYGADAVTITLFEGSRPTGEPVACIEIGVFKRTIVTLDEPLGDRTIVDGAA